MASSASVHEMPVTSRNTHVQERSNPGKPPEQATLGAESTSVPSLCSHLLFSLFLPHHLAPTGHSA